MGDGGWDKELTRAPMELQNAVRLGPTLTERKTLGTKRAHPVLVVFSATATTESNHSGTGPLTGIGGLA